MKLSGLVVCASLALAAAFTLGAAHASTTEKILYTFMTGTGGGVPTGALTADSTGNLYGVTGAGGDATCPSGTKGKGGCGVVFEVTPSGTPSVLYTFKGVSSHDGATPVGGVLRNTSGTLFGTTAQGGSRESSCKTGCGTVYSLTSTGTLTILHAFKSGDDGQGPSIGLLMDSKGNLYGTTAAGGGANPCGDTGAPGCGTIYKVTSAGKESILHSFAGGSDDGAYPIGSLIADSKDNFYGTTVAGGGTDSCGILPGQGCGIVFKLATNGTLTILHAFTGGSDGAYPTGTLLFDSHGDIYGTTVGGGSDANCGVGPYGCGTIFELPAAGGENVLHAFQGGSKDGAYPTSGVIADTSGNLYGVTGAGGGTRNCGLKFMPIAGCGTAFELTKAGKESVLHIFNGKSGEGGYPVFALIRNSAGVLFGATTAGGDTGCVTGAGKLNCGTVYSLTK